MGLAPWLLILLLRRLLIIRLVLVQRNMLLSFLLLCLFFPDLGLDGFVLVWGYVFLVIDPSHLNLMCPVHVLLLDYLGCRAESDRSDFVPVQEQRK